MSLLALVSAAALSGPPLTLPPQLADTACQILLPNDVPVEGRKSPLDSLTFLVAKQPVKLCYGRPSSRGRVMLGGAAVPYGKLWRTGANEPTTIHTTAPIVVAGIRIPAGATSLYTVPGESSWEVVLNSSTEQWGDEGSYDKVRATEIGRAKVTAGHLGTSVEQFTLRQESKGGTTVLILEWETTRISVPVETGR